MERTVQDYQEENTRLRAALASSSGACIYCQLPKEQWGACRSGFPGCARADDASGCPEFGAATVLDDTTKYVAVLEKALQFYGKCTGAEFGFDKGALARKALKHTNAPPTEWDVNG